MPCEHLNGKHTIFGRLLSGEDTLQRIAEVDVDKDDRPLEPVLISRCGELEKKKKKIAAPLDTPPPSQSRDRGRRRRSDGSDVEMSNSPEPGLLYKHRRQSDNLIDEGIRGRPRLRSGSRSPQRSRSVHDETEDSERGSPPKKHKRKRSQSPSRHAGLGSNERRRRSLPNQYRDRREARVDGDEQRYKPSPRRDGQRHGSGRWEERERTRKDDRYRPSRERNPYGEDGRLGGGSYDDHEPPVKFKGRGVMKYREPERQC